MYRILIAHPGKQHSMQMALAVKKHGDEFKYCTTVYNKNSFLMKMGSLFLKRNDKNKAEKRKIDGLEDKDVIQFCEIEGLLLLLLYRIDKSKILYYKFSEWVQNRFAKKIAKYAIKEKFDIVIMYDTTATACFKLLKEKAPNIIRVIDHAQTPRNYLYHVYQKLKPECKQFWETFKGARYLNDETYGQLVLLEISLADFHVVASTFSKKALENSEVHQEKIFVVPYGVDHSKFSYIKKNKHKKLKLLFVGEINQRKGIYQILEAAKQINNVNIEFHLVGYGKQFNENLYKPYEKYVKFHGGLFGEELQKIYKECDVFLFPVLGEGFGLVVLEALSSGLPVISSKNCAGVDLIKNNYNGKIIDAGSTEQLINAIYYYFNNMNNLDLFQQNAYKSSLKYTWERYYISIGKILDQI